MDSTNRDIVQKSFLSAAPFLLELRNITKQYPNTKKKANNNINLQIKKGEILCIAGENGAGKSTLMKILMGLEKANAGEILFNGKKQKINSPLDAKKLGIGMVHQHFMLFEDYTAAQNIVMGNEPRKWRFFLDKKKTNVITEKIIGERQFSIKATQIVKELTLGLMQQVEICRILYQNADVIILDEPTSILTEQETESLFKTIKQLASLGKSAIFITHKLQEITQICDRVIVLKNGEVVGNLEGDRINEKNIANLMAGNCEAVKTTDVLFESGEKNLITNKVPAARHSDAAANLEKTPIITFENVTVKRQNQTLPLLDNVSFTVHSGEILGFTGVGGNGLGVIEAVLGGFLHPAEGRVLHKGRDISDLSIHALRKQGLAFVPADRLTYGSAKDATVAENMIISRHHEYFKYGLINKKMIREAAKKLADKYCIEGDIQANASTLSGGNLQKLILAREINNFTDYIVFSEPTWGLDISASGFIMKEIAALRDRGAAIILISTNMEEVIALVDKVIVMNKGAILSQSNTAGVKA